MQRETRECTTRTKRRKASWHSEERWDQAVRSIVFRDATTQQEIVTWRAHLSLEEPAQLTSRVADFLRHHTQICLHVVITVPSDCGWETLCLTAWRTKTELVTTPGHITNILTNSHTCVTQNFTKFVLYSYNFDLPTSRSLEMCATCNRGQGSVVGIVTALRDGQPGVKIPVDATPNHADWFWGPPSG